MPSVLRIKNPDGTWYEVTALKGDTGITPNLQVGTVTTGNPGTSAEVTITGTPEEPVLNFKIPKGEPGTDGSGTVSYINHKGPDDAGNVALAAGDVGAVPDTRKINNMPLSSDITLSAENVSAVPITRTVNGKELSADVTLTPEDVSAVPTTRKVNDKPLSSDITLIASDVGALATGGTAADSSKLGGKSPEYYATAQSFSSLKNDIMVNLLRPTLQTTTVNGVTCTNNGDGTYTLNGTSTSQIDFIFTDYFTLKKGNYKLLGNPFESYNNCFGFLQEHVNGYAVGNYDIIITGANIDTDKDNIVRLVFRIGTIGVTFNNVIYKPMLTDDLSATYDDFVSYDDSFVKGREVISKDSISDAWTSGKTYAVGDYCISGNRLYKCKTAHTAWSAFNSDYWEAVSVTGEIGSLKFGKANIYSAQNTNVNSITIDASPVMNDLNSVTFVLLLRDWASSKSLGAIGCFNMSTSPNTGLPGDAYIIADPENRIASMETSRDNATFTVNLQSNFSFVKLIYIY